MRRVYKRRRDAFLDALTRAFGDRATVIGDASGMHLVVRFESAAIAPRAARAGVHLVSTRAYYAGEAPAARVHRALHRRERARAPRGGETARGLRRV